MTEERRTAMRGLLIGAIVLVLDVACLDAAAVAQTSDPPPASVALVATYADGRVLHQLVSVRPARSWTATFPRIASWKLPEGALPITALQIARQLVGPD